MDSKLKELFGRLGPIRVIDRVSSGSPENIILKWKTDLRQVRTIPAILTLARRGMTMLRAKRAIEAMCDDGVAIVHVPTVEDLTVLTAELAEAGVAAKRIVSEPIDVKSVRAQLGLTQEQFAMRFGLELDALQNWEQGRTKPDKAAQSYLRVISMRPRETSEALEEAFVPNELVDSK